MTNTIQILSIEKTGKESSLQKEHNNKSIKIIDGYFFSKNLDNQNFNKISKLISNEVSQTILTKKNNGSAPWQRISLRHIPTRS